MEELSNIIFFEFVIRIFGKAKVRLNQREFWCVADSIQSRFETVNKQRRSKSIRLRKKVQFLQRKRGTKRITWRQNKAINIKLTA